MAGTLFPITDGIEIDGTVPAPGRVTMSNGTFAVSLQASSTIASNYSVSLPDNAGTTGQVLTLLTPSTSDWNTPIDPKNIWFIWDQKASGTNGGPLVFAVWTTRVLNTLTKPTGTGTEVQLAVAPAVANQILIQAGVYRVHIEAPVCDLRYHMALLRNITLGIDQLLGTSAMSCDRGQGSTTNSVIDGVIELPIAGGANVFEVWHQRTRNTAPRNIDFGRPVGIAGYPEKYTSLWIQKLD